MPERWRHLECLLILITLWLFNIAMENGPFIDDFPIKTSIFGGFSMAMLNNQRVYVSALQVRRATTAVCMDDCVDDGIQLWIAGSQSCWTVKRWPSRKTMGKPWENHGKTMGKPWENHGKMVVLWDLMGFTLVMTNSLRTWKLPSRNSTFSHSMMIFHSYVVLPEGQRRLTRHLPFSGEHSLSEAISTYGHMEVSNWGETSLSTWLN